LFEVLPDTEAKLIGVVHDEILLECPQQTLKKTTLLLKRVMIEAGQQYLHQVPIEVDVKTALSWG
jgi:DNA polymerase I